MPQRLILPIQGRADGSGAITFRFQAPPPNLIWTGTVAVPNALATASWQAQVGSVTGGVVLGAWLGTSPFGPIQMFGNETLLVIGTGLTPNSLVTAVFVGRSDPIGEEPPALPIPIPTSVTVATGSPVLVFPANTVVTEQAYGQASSAGASALYSRGDHTHGTPTDPRNLPIPAACVTRTTDLGPIAQATETTISWQASEWDNSGMWNGTDTLQAYLSGMYTVYGGSFWLDVPGGVNGHVTSHVKLNGTIIIDPHAVIDSNGPLVGPSLTFSRDFRLTAGDDLVMTVLYQYSPATVDLSLLAGVAYTYFGITWKGPYS